MVKATYLKLVGKENKNVSKSYLFETLSYKDTEDQAIECLKDNISGEFNVSDIKKVSYSEVFDYPIEEENNTEIEKFWYESKVLLTILDENSGAEKKLTQKFLIEALNIENACFRLKEIMEDSNNENFRILTMDETPILGIYRLSDLKSI